MAKKSIIVEQMLADTMQAITERFTPENDGERTYIVASMPALSKAAGYDVKDIQKAITHLIKSGKIRIERLPLFNRCWTNKISIINK